MNLTVYLAGEIHTDWRIQLKKIAEERGLPITFVGPQENHDLSDDIGEKIIGKQPNNLYRDHVGASVNNLRTQVLMQKSDLVIALFGEKYKQWNTAMDASMAIALNKPLILIRPEEHIHPLKELSNRANVVVENVDQALEVIAYIFD